MRLVHQAVALIATLTADDDLDHALACTAAARDTLDAALNELMAAGVLEGGSLRAIAAQAGLAPNSVATRLARSSALGAYSTDGRVRTEAVHQARAEKAGPLRFQPRRPTA